MLWGAQGIVLLLCHDVYRLTLAEETSTREQVIFFLNLLSKHSHKQSQSAGQGSFTQNASSGCDATGQRLSQPPPHPRRHTAIQLGTEVDSSLKGFAGQWGRWALEREGYGWLKRGGEAAPDSNRHQSTSNQEQHTDRILIRTNQLRRSFLRQSGNSEYRQMRPKDHCSFYYMQ